MKVCTLQSLCHAHHSVIALIAYTRWHDMQHNRTDSRVLNGSLSILYGVTQSSGQLDACMFKIQHAMHELLQGTPMHGPQ